MFLGFRGWNPGRQVEMTRTGKKEQMLSASKSTEDLKKYVIDCLAFFSLNIFFFFSSFHLPLFNGGMTKTTNLERETRRMKLDFTVSGPFFFWNSCFSIIFSFSLAV